MHAKPDPLAARVEIVEQRLAEMVEARTTATLREEVRAELTSGRWALVVDTVIRWGVPAILAAAGWSLVTWLRSL